MKNKSFWVLLVAGVLFLGLAAAVYICGGITEEMTDSISYRQTGNGGKIVNDTSISQSFFCKYNRITSLIMRISTLGNTYTDAEAVFTLENEKGEEIARQVVPLQGVKDKSAITFSFPELQGTGGQVLTFKAQAQNLEEEECYSLMIGQGSVGGELITADGKTSENSSLFMNISYKNIIRAEHFTYFLMIIGVILLSLVPMCSGRKGGR